MNAGKQKRHKELGEQSMSRNIHTRLAGLLLLVFLLGPAAAFAGENWLQFKYDCRHSGNVPDRSVAVPLGLVGAVPLTDAVFTAPVVADSVSDPSRIGRCGGQFTSSAQ